MSNTYKGWTYFRRVDMEDGRMTNYAFHFYRLTGDWYDEIRYDSHDKKRGRAVIAPHFHVKLRSALKTNPDAAVEEIKEIIDNHIGSLDLVVKR